MPLNIPNLLTWGRIVLIPLFVGVFYAPHHWLAPAEQNQAATLIFVIAAITDWLDGWLAAGKGAAHVVTMHVPPQDPIGTRAGAFSSNAEANKLLSKLGAAGVTATFYGHIHSYYAYENAGIPAIITGGGGAIPERMDTIGRHFMTVDIDPARRTVASSMVAVDHD